MRRDGNRSSRDGLGLAVAFALAIAAFYLALTPWTTLWDRDEPRFAQAAVEMLASGNYLFPTFNGELRPHKPILIYWLMAQSTHWFGPTELAFRFWSPVGIGVAALFTFLIGRRLRSARTGLAAMVVLALNPLVALEAVAATADAALLAAVTGSLAAFVSIHLDGPRRANVAGLVAALTLAQLLKGPVGIVVPAAIMGATMLATRRTSSGLSGRLSAIAAGSLLSLLLFCAWAIPANTATDGRLLTEGLVQQMARRIWQPLEGHGGSLLLYLPYYPIVMVAGMLPWTRWLPAALRGLTIGGSWPESARAFLWFWILGPIALFTLASTKLPHYILPIWPALSLAVGGLLVDGGRELASRDAARWLRRGWWMAFVLAGLALAALSIGITTLAMPFLAAPAVALGIVITATAVATTRAERSGRHLVAAGSSALGTAVALVIICAWAGPLVDELKPVPRLVAMMEAGTPADLPIAMCEVGEPSLVFYMRRLPVVDLPRHDLESWVGQPGAGILVTTREIARDLELRGFSARLSETASAAGINIAKGRRVELVALCRACGS